SDQKEVALNQLLDWLEAPEKTLWFAALTLYQGQHRIMVRTVELPGVITCTPDEFHDMRQCWVEKGFPANLFYPASDARHEVDPVEFQGGVVLVARDYSTVQWLARDSAHI